MATISSVLVITLSLYVLSLGPVLNLVTHGYPGLEKALAGFYAPLVWVSDHCSAIKDAIDRYLALWIDK